MSDLDVLESTEWITRRDLERCNGQEELEALEAALLLRAEVSRLRASLTAAQAEREEAVRVAREAGSVLDDIEKRAQVCPSCGAFRSFVPTGEPFYDDGRTCTTGLLVTIEHHDDCRLDAARKRIGDLKVKP